MGRNMLSSHHCVMHPVGPGICPNAAQTREYFIHMARQATSYLCQVENVFGKSGIVCGEHFVKPHCAGTISWLGQCLCVATDVPLYLSMCMWLKSMQLISHFMHSPTTYR